MDDLEFYEDLAGEYAAHCLHAEETKEAIIRGMCGITYALLDIAAAIREAASLRDPKSAMEFDDPTRAIFFRRFTGADYPTRPSRRRRDEAGDSTVGQAQPQPS